MIIYSFSDEYEYLRELLLDESSNVSEISRVEVLGYHGLNAIHKMYFLDIFSYMTVIMPTKEIFNKAIEVRQQYNLKLGDSIIAATSLVHDLDLYTRNLKDFERIEKLNCINPSTITKAS
ncbi:hypothetical protein SAMN05216436_106185 [bacterium A37T11]|nr:hypothetical protein SAMN05216436_106185 [bacterium A37T11]